MTINEALEAIRDGTHRADVEKVRRLTAEHGHDHVIVKAAKKRLQGVTFAGTFTKRNRDSLEAHSGILCLDFDKLKDPAKVRATVSGDPYCLAAWISPTGTGIKVLVPVVASDNESHQRAFFSAQDHFRERHGQEIDKSGKDVSRLCFMSYDPEIFIASNAAWRDAKPFKPKPAPQGATSITWTDNKSPARPHRPAEVDKIRSALSVIPSRPDYDKWLRITSAVFSELGEDEGIRVLSEWSPPEREREYEDKFKHRPQDIRIGTLFHIATSEHGWVYPQGPHGIGAAQSMQISLPVDQRFIESSASRDQAGAAELIAGICDGKVLFDHTAGLWRIYRNGVWERDELRHARQYIRKELQTTFRRAAKVRRAEMDAMLEKGVGIKDVENSESGVRWKTLIGQIAALNKRAYLDNVLHLAGDGPEMGVLTTEFDADPFLFACSNGVLDLRMITFREPSPRDRLAKRSLVEYKPEATCPKWEHFIDTIFCGNKELGGFLQRLFGYCLTGEVGLDAVSISYGGGGNGKSVLYNVLTDIFGDYASHLPIEALLQQGNKRDASADYEKMKLLGARFVVASEIPAHRNINESLLKDISGGDIITARSPYEKPLSFKPTHKLHLMGNHKPSVRGTDDGIWRRLYLVPFNHRFAQPGEPGHRTKEAVLEELKAEKSGILNWLLAGLRDLREKGLNPPGMVKGATDEFRRESDQVQTFVDECCIETASYSIAVGDLYRRYKEFCEAEEERPISKKALSQALEGKGFRREHNGRARCFIGITTR